MSNKRMITLSNRSIMLVDSNLPKWKMHEQIKTRLQEMYVGDEYVKYAIEAMNIIWVWEL